MNAAGPTKGHAAAPFRRQAPEDHRFRPVRRLAAAPMRQRASPTAPRSAACTRQSTPCSIRDKYPDTDVYVFYIDVRTPGKNFDEFYRRAVEEYGVNYIKGHGRQGHAAAERQAAWCRASDLLDNKQIHDRRRHGRPRRGDRARYAARAPHCDHADRQHRYQRLLHRGSPEAAPGRKSRRRAYSSPAYARARRIFRKRSRRRARRLSKVIGLLREG